MIGPLEAGPAGGDLPAHLQPRHLGHLHLRGPEGRGVPRSGQRVQGYDLV